MCGARRRAEGVLRGQNCHFFELLLMLGSFHGHSSHLSRDIARTHESEVVDRKQQMITTSRRSLVRARPRLPVRRLENTLKHTKFCIFRSVHSDHTSPTMIHETTLHHIVLNVLFFHLSEFHAIPIRFNPSNTFGGLRGRIDPLTTKIATRKKDRDFRTL